MPVEKWSQWFAEPAPARIERGGRWLGTDDQNVIPSSGDRSAAWPMVCMPASYSFPAVRIAGLLTLAWIRTMSSLFPLYLQWRAIFEGSLTLHGMG